jgi:hydrogenase maturation factor HypE
LANGETYKRQVNPDAKQVLFRNMNSHLMEMVDDCCEIRGITRKQWFEETCEKFIQSTMIGVKQVLGDELPPDFVWDKNKVKNLIRQK